MMAAPAIFAGTVRFVGSGDSPTIGESGSDVSVTNNANNISIITGMDRAALSVTAGFGFLHVGFQGDNGAPGGLTGPLVAGLAAEMDDQDFTFTITSSAAAAAMGDGQEYGVWFEVNGGLFDTPSYTAGGGEFLVGFTNNGGGIWAFITVIGSDFVALGGNTPDFFNYFQGDFDVTGTQYEITLTRTADVWAVTFGSGDAVRYVAGTGNFTTANAIIDFADHGADVNFHGLLGVNLFTGATVTRAELWANNDGAGPIPAGAMTFQCLEITAAGVTDVNSGSVCPTDPPPVFTVQTAASDEAPTEGDAVFVSATATGADTYQWQVDTGSGFGDIADGGNISGATTPALGIDPISQADSGSYRLCATGPGGTVCSDPVAILVQFTTEVFAETWTPVAAGTLLVGFGAFNLDLGTVAGDFTWEAMGFAGPNPVPNIFTLPTVSPAVSFEDDGSGNIVLTRTARGDDWSGQGSDPPGNSLESKLATPIDDDAICSITLSLKVGFSAGTPAAMKVDNQAFESLSGFGSGIPFTFGSLPFVVDRGGSDGSIVFGVGDGSAGDATVNVGFDLALAPGAFGGSGTQANLAVRLSNYSTTLVDTNILGIGPFGGPHTGFPNFQYVDATFSGLADSHPRLFVGINNPYSIGAPSAGTFGIPNSNPPFFMPVAALTPYDIPGGLTPTTFFLPIAASNTSQAGWWMDVIGTTFLSSWSAVYQAPEGLPAFGNGTSSGAAWNQLSPPPNTPGVFIDDLFGGIAGPGSGPFVGAPFSYCVTATFVKDQASKATTEMYYNIIPLDGGPITTGGEVGPIVMGSAFPFNKRITDVGIALGSGAVGVSVDDLTVRTFGTKTVDALGARDWMVFQ
jgi:hypothetical protein